MKFPNRDIHNHLLPGVDDGFQNATDSLEAVRRLSGNGCKDIVFTPHMNPDVYPDHDEAFLRSAYANFAPTIPSEWGVKTALAAEYMVVPGFEDRADDPSLLTYDDGSILIEMSYYFPSRNIEQAIFNLVMAGRKPILAHPERYTYLAGSLRSFEKYVDMGCRLQMNLLSLSGIYGPESVNIMKFLLDEGFYSFAASDLHSLDQLDLIEESSVKRILRKRLPEVE